LVLLTPELEAIKKICLSERQNMIKKVRCVNQLETDDWQQSLCLCKECNRHLFKMCNIKGTTKDYEQHGMFNFVMSEFVIAVKSINDPTLKTNMFSKIWLSGV